MQFVIIVIVILAYIVWNYYKNLDIKTITKEIAQERCRYCQANWDHRRYTFPLWEDVTMFLWVKWYQEMLEKPLQLPTSQDRYLSLQDRYPSLFQEDIHESITAPPPADVVDDMVKEACELARSKGQFSRTRHIVYIDCYYRIGVYRSAVQYGENLPWWDKVGSFLITEKEKQKIIRIVNKYIPESM